MKLIEDWKSFKARKPNKFYSYVWWETLLSFYFIITWLIFLMVFALIDNWWLLIISFSHFLAAVWWDFRELKGRKKYWSEGEQNEN